MAFPVPSAKARLSGLPLGVLLLEKQDAQTYYAQHPIPRMPLRRRTCRLCYRQEHTHSDRMYEVKPGQLLCIYDMALVSEAFREIVPDGEEAYTLVRS